jgi:SNF2 family DNA or RNA helicase
MDSLFRNGGLGLSSAALLATAQFDLEIGDRFEVQAAQGGTALRVPADFPEDRDLSVEIEPGRAVACVRGPNGLVPVAGLAGFLEQPWQALWLQFAGKNLWRLRIDGAEGDGSEEEIVTEQGVPIALARDDLAAFRDGNRAPATRPDLELALRAARLANHAGFDQLICLPLVRDMEILDHQVRTAKTVLQRLRGRALLCDEVGLGKTIEAGLVLSELCLRGLAKGVLVLVPPSLIEQWQGEMRRKFSMELTGHDDPVFRQRGSAAWAEFDHVIASFHTAKREPHRSAILRRTWDLVIVDEAHHLRNRATQLWRFVSEVQKQFILLLTATPVQNNLDELFNLVTVLEPGLLSTAKKFQKQFVDRKDKLTPRNVDELHRLLSEVMVRNRRSTVGLQFTRRWARTERVTMTTGEQELYETAAAFVRRHLQGPALSERSQIPQGGMKIEEGLSDDRQSEICNQKSLSRMALLSLQMALGSSSQAAAGTLGRLAENTGLPGATRSLLSDLAGRARAQTDSAKVNRLLEILREFPDKMVIFTQFRATQEMLAQRLEQAGQPAAVFHGGLTRLEKERAVDRFRGPVRLLLCTEAGSEGRNLQFAHGVCNFDLPWNPMKIEQRIGRLSRIGQTHDVHVFNLVAAGTVEAAVLNLLEAKLNLFELVIGEIDMILGNLEEEREFQEVVADLWAESADGGDFHRRMEELGNRLLTAKEAYFAQKSVDDKLFADRFGPDR